MLEPGSHDFALTIATESFDEYIFGEETQTQSLQTTSYSLFYEHAASKKASIVLSIPYLEIDEVNRGLQDGNLFIKYRHEQKASKTGEWSVFSAWGLTAPLSNYPKDTDNPIGVGALGLNARLLAQHNFNSGLFIQLQSGLDFRLLDVPQTSIPILFRTGFGAQHYFIEGWVEWYNTLDNGVDQSITGGSGSDWIRLGGTLYIPIVDSLGIVGNYARILDGKNIGLSNRYGAGIVYRLSKK
jgi:hypothetical protein